MTTCIANLSHFKRGRVRIIKKHTMNKLFESLSRLVDRSDAADLAGLSLGFALATALIVSVLITLL